MSGAGSTPAIEQADQLDQVCLIYTKLAGGDLLQTPRGETLSGTYESDPYTNMIEFRDHFQRERTEEENALGLFQVPCHQRDFLKNVTFTRDERFRKFLIFFVPKGPREKREFTNKKLKYRYAAEKAQLCHRL